MSRVPLTRVRTTPRRRTAVVALLTAVLTPLAVVGPADGAVAAETRDPLTWPFARDSIWNTPIGSDAKYVPAGLRAANAAWNASVTADPELISVDPDDPIRTLRAPYQPGDGARVRVAPDLAHDGSWNGCATFLTSDGRSVWSGQPLRLSRGGTPTWKWTSSRQAIDLRGPGIEGCHGGSRMSGIGGSLRVGELASEAPLRHALKVNLNCAKYCYRGSSRADSKRWPAFTADAYWASGYGGRLPALRMGALLALPPSVDLSGITDPKARKLANAFRDYGAYLVDDTAWDVHTVAMDQRVVESGEWPDHTEREFHAQLQEVFRALAVVDNNAPSTVGGGGRPRAPLAPCFSDETACLASARTATSDDATDEDGSDVPLSALAPRSAVNGWGPVETDSSNGESAAGDGRTLTVAGRSYARGLGVHAGSDVTYDLAGRYAHFTTDVGIDDEVGSAGSAVFEVYVDGVLRARTGRRTGADGPLPLSLSVAGARTLRLVVTDAGDGIGSDHADWLDARLWVPRESS